MPPAARPQALAVDTSAIVAKITPVLQQALLTAIGQVPGLSTITSATGLPTSTSELYTYAEAAAAAAWSLLPLPAPFTVYLHNGLDAPGQIDVGTQADVPGTVMKDNGAYFRAPMTGA